MLPPALNKAKSTPSNDSGTNSSIVNSCSLKNAFFPAERLEANNFTALIGKVDCSNISIIFVPTAPVAPTTATVYSLATRHYSLY